MTAAQLSDLNPFDILDTEAARLDAYFTRLTDQEWDRPSRCAGWSVRDVLAHLAGQELYNHACLDNTVDALLIRMEKEGIGGLDDFNEWAVRARRGLPLDAVIDEWRRENGETRRRMRERGAAATLPTMVGPYPVGMQTFHYCSEYATHGDDIDVPVDAAELPGRTDWRARVGLLALDESDAPVQVEEIPGGYRVTMDQQRAELSAEEFVDATVGRLPDGRPLPEELRAALRGLA